MSASKVVCEEYDKLIEKERWILKIWITKYALTQGILELEAERCNNTNPDLIKTEKHGFFLGEGKEWYTTKEEAITKAEQIKQAKINGLKKQLKKLENMSFE